MDGSIREAWQALMAELDARKRELAQAVRDYPTPIARCDDQLPGAIALRDAAAQRVRCATGLEAAREALPPAQWSERVRDFTLALAAGDDAALERSRRRVLEALDAG